MQMYNWRNFSDLANTIRNNVKILPSDIDLIVGIPRSGMIPAYMIALFLNKQACSIDEYLNNIDLHRGERPFYASANSNRKVLIVDDSVHSGVSLNKVKNRIALNKDKLIGDTLYYCAIYAREQSKGLVDFYFEELETPRLFQWNYLNHNINSKSCFDIDGVLCCDPEPWQNDDGEKYINFIKNAKPLFIPSYTIKALVTSRLEKYRKVTEEWLKNNNVKYEELYMLNLPSKEERLRLKAHGSFKAEIYSKLTDAELFIESDYKQAKEICALTNKPVICVSTDEIFYPSSDLTSEFLKTNKLTLNNKRILLCSHELTYTGAPHSLLRICKILIKNGAQVEVWSRYDGEFRQEFEKLNVFVRIVSDSLVKTEKIAKLIATFDLAIINTVISHKFFLASRNLIPTIWYIREAHNLPEISDKVKDRYRALITADKLYCVSEYAKEFIENHYNKNVKVIHNCVEDYYTGESNIVKKYINFAVIGSVTYRKAFDVCVDAFEQLPVEKQNKCNLFFAGQLIESRKDYWQPLLERIKNNDRITYIGEIKNLKDKIKFYQEMNVIIVVSRDESCSLVVLEGAMMGKAIIVSENVGAKYIVDNDCGWIVKTGSVSELVKVFEEIIENPQSLVALGKNARRNYEKTSTMEIYEQNIITMIKDTIKYDFRQKYREMSSTSLAHQLERQVRKYERLEKKILVVGNSNDYKRNNEHLLKEKILEILRSIDEENKNYLVRKIRGGYYCYKEHGIKYTLKRIKQKLTNRFK